MSIHNLINPKSISKNRGARLLAVQAAYLNYFVPSSNCDSLIDQITELSEVPYQSELLQHLISCLLLHCEQFDKVIVSNLSSEWRIDRLDLIVLSILRIAVGELIFSPDTASNLIINEYVSIASYFLASTEVNFINGILENITKTLRVDV